MTGSSWSLIPFEQQGMTAELLILLANLATGKDKDAKYWQSCVNFLDSLDTTEVISLTYLQQEWLYSIIAGLTVKQNRLIAIEVFVTAFGPSMGNGRMINKGSLYRIPFSASRGATKFN